MRGIKNIIKNSLWKGIFVFLVISVCILFVVSGFRSHPHTTDFNFVNSENINVQENVIKLHTELTSRWVTSYWFFSFAGHLQQTAVLLLLFWHDDVIYIHQCIVMNYGTKFTPFVCY